MSQPYPVPIPLPQPKSRPLPDSRGIPDTPWFGPIMWVLILKLSKSFYSKSALLFYVNGSIAMIACICMLLCINASPQTNKKFLLQFINVSNSYDYSYWENASLNLQSYQNLEQITIFTYCTLIAAQTAAL